MSNNEIRQPVQKRSIEKKNKIIKAGFDLICEKGYYNITTVDIAKAAGVSTGIVYNYFSDKHDILIDAIKVYVSELFYPMFNIDSTSKINKSDLKNVLTKMLNELLENHKVSKIAHEEFMTMTHSDREVAKYFNEYEIKMCDNITTIFLNSGFSENKLKEKTHIAMGIVENFCHEVVYHKHKELDYDVMKEAVINTLLNLFDE